VKAVGLEPTTYGLKVREDADAKSESVNTSADSAPLVAPWLLETVQADPQLTRLITCWPTFPEHVRKAILTLADG